MIITLICLTIPLGILVWTLIYYRQINNAKERWSVMSIDYGNDIKISDMSINICYYGQVEIEFIATAAKPACIEITTNELFSRKGANLPRTINVFDQPAQKETIEICGENVYQKIVYDNSPRNRSSAIINSQYYFGFSNTKMEQELMHDKLAADAIMYPNAENFSVKFREFSFVSMSNITPRPDRIVGHTIIFDSPETISPLMREGIYLAGYDFVRNNKNQSIIFFLGIIIGAMLSIISSVLLNALFVQP